VFLKVLKRQPFEPDLVNASEGKWMGLKLSELRFINLVVAFLTDFHLILDKFIFDFE